VDCAFLFLFLIEIPTKVQLSVNDSRLITKNRGNVIGSEARSHAINTRDGGQPQKTVGKGSAHV
jgi:hypothetical protein